MQQLIVISDPCPVAQEAKHINQLFGAGMAVFHLRKPGYSEAALQHLLEQIDAQYLDRIALHQHHRLAYGSGIKRLHFPEVMRLAYKGPEFAALAESGFTLSTSIHDSTSYQQLAPAFAYIFLGPFAASISKPGYAKAIAPDLSQVNKQGTRIIALGGIQADNLLQPLTMGFDGVAVLGSIWKDERVSENFKKLQNIWHTADHRY